MRRLRFDHLLASSALALALATSGSQAFADAEPDGGPIAVAVSLTEPAYPPQREAAEARARPAAPTQGEIEAKIPLPESANLPPPSLADIGGPATATAERPVATAPLPAAVIPVPEAADVPPPTINDIGALPAVVPQDTPMIAAMREVIGAKLAGLIERKTDRTALEAFYAGRKFTPLWIENDEASDRAKAAIAHLAAAAEDGLDPGDYPTPVFKAGAEPAALAEAEVKLTAAVLTYARHAQSGRVHWSRVSADIHYGHAAPEPADILAKFADAPQIGETLASFNPPHAGYKALKAKLGEARKHTGETRVPGGPVLKLGKVLMEDNRVPLVRQRLGLAGDANDRTYDKPLAEAVAKFQRERGLPPSGQLNSATIDAFNGPRRDRDVDIILANMERWRWLPRELAGATHAYVMLNIPDFHLNVYHRDKVAWRTRVVVGKPTTPTPILTETMKHITVNPTWNVPPSIVYNEYLPALQQDPTVLRRMGLNVSQNRDGSIHISQPPGEKNALGRIRFNFPNKFLVYQHDTPEKFYFDHDRRTASHGCMRVQDPAKYAEVLLSIARPNEGYTQDRIRRMFGGNEQDIHLPVPIPVHIVYQTAFVDDAGKLQIRGDVYGRDERVLAALKGEDRRYADMPIERAKQGYARPAVRLPWGATDGGGPGLFGALFGFSSSPQPARANQRRSSERPSSAPGRGGSPGWPNWN